MKLFVWQNDGVSAAWHDDGVIVILASDEAEARAVYPVDRDRLEKADVELGNRMSSSYRAWRAKEQAKDKTATVTWAKWELTSEGKALTAERQAMVNMPDSVPLPERPADYVIDLETTEARIVAFCGGGYD